MIRIELLKLQEKVIRCLARTFEYGMVCCIMFKLGNALMHCNALLGQTGGYEAAVGLTRHLATCTAIYLPSQL